jgi:probable H4MPT-linked C1 transfer pathway protein
MILTLDIGGANTKSLTYENQKSRSVLNYFPIWEKKDKLPNLLKRVGERADKVAVTMTAELSDIFHSKEYGTRFIVDACQKAFKDPYFLKQTQELVKIIDDRAYRELAATNWLASLYLMEKKFGEGLLVDVGSTTTDILSFGKGSVKYKSDLERLKAGELVYTGYLRTPVNTIVNEFPLNGTMIPIASEYFAITADVYTILWGVPYSWETPDGKGKTYDDSIKRIARLLCAEKEEIEGYITEICTYVYNAQVEKIADSVARVYEASGVKKIYVAGAGKKLGLDAVKFLDLVAVDLEKEIKDAWNLPCLGILEMVLDMGVG